jgi:hypothetical protein
MAGIGTGIAVICLLTIVSAILLFRLQKKKKTLQKIQQTHVSLWNHHLSPPSATAPSNTPPPDANVVPEEASVTASGSRRSIYKPAWELVNARDPAELKSDREVAELPGCDAYGYGHEYDALKR